MARFILRKKIVFCVVLFFCQPVQLLETGYEYSSNELIESDRVYNDLKCAYLFSGLTHMLITQILIAPPYNFPINLKAGNVSYYRNTIKYHIASLYKLKVSIGSLWLLHLYLSTTPGLHLKDNIQADYLKLVATHEYVIKKLRKDLKECRIGNSYDSFDDMINSKPHPTKDDLHYMVYKNYNANKELLKTNGICTKSYNDKFGEAIKLKRLFMNHLCTKKTCMQDLMNAFNVQVSWSDITDRFKKSLHDARTLDWTNDNLQNIKSYFMLNYSFLKIIMFRLTLKHMTYLQDYLEGSEYYLYNARYWYIIVEQFGSMLSLTNDLQVKNLLTSIFNLSTGKDKIDSVVSYVVSILFSLCLPLGCKATEPFNIDNKEFEIHYKSSMNEISCEPIEYNSLENTRVFLFYLSQVFENVDFSLIQLLIEYIDEIKLENDMEGYTQLHLDFLDFD